MEIQNWIRGLGYPESLEEIYDLQKNGIVNPKYQQKSMNIYSDGTLQVLSSNLIAKFNLVVIIQLLPELNEEDMPMI